MTTEKEFNAEEVQCADDHCTKLSVMLINYSAWCVDHLPHSDPNDLGAMFKAMVMALSTQGHEIDELREALLDIGRHTRTHCIQINGVKGDITALKVVVPTVETASGES